MYKKNNRRTGTGYERKAGAYLESLGYKIVTYNYRCRLGEIDLIAKEGETLVFVEVKYRRDDKMGNPKEAVDRKKQKKIIPECLFRQSRSKIQKNKIPDNK